MIVFSNEENWPMALSLPEKIDPIQEILVKRKAQVSIGNCVQSVLMFWKTWEPKA